ncbi:hypothetical protein [Qipengyuania sp. ASV99]|uniref:hypothetical protein n=1 Tax=Qipengyuania sp. ASV99 TaxID=3399681 RepID=UPI003A4C7641
MLLNRGHAALLRSAIMALAAAAVTVAPVEACPTLPREVSKRNAEQWRQDRLRADVVVVGTFYRAESEGECGTYITKSCTGKIVAEKVRRGAKLAEYTVGYYLEFNMCDARNMAPHDGARAKFYINGSPEAGYYLMETVWIERE